MYINKERIQNYYYSILEELKQKPGAEQALNSLIKLETNIEDAISDILKNYKEQGIEIEKTNIYKSINKGGIDLRNKIEKKIMQIFTGDKVSISDLHQQFIDKIGSILAVENIDDILKEAKIYHQNIDDTILPPDLIGTQIGSGDCDFEKKEGHNKFGVLIELLREYGVYTDDLYVIKGKNKSNQMRVESYLYIHIPRINKTILINNGYGEKTFIYDGYVDIDYFIQQTKKDIKQDDKIRGVNFDYENPDNWKSKVKHYLFENNSEKVVKDKVDIKEFFKAPTGWKTNKALCKELNIDQGTTKRVADKYRETNPEFFKRCLIRIVNRLGEHYSPELCKKIKEEIENRGERASQSWITNSELADEIGSANNFIKRIADGYRETNPEWFKEYLNKANRISEHYSPELCKKIKEELENQGEKAPEGWKTNSKVYKEFGVNQRVTKRIVDGYRETNPEWFKEYLDKARRPAEHYSPELCKRIKEELDNRGEKAPKGWMTNTTLSYWYKVDKGTTKRVADKYRETNPEWFREYFNKANRVSEYYSPELCDKIKEELNNRGKRSPVSWNTKTALESSLGIAKESIKRIADGYRETNPEWFREYLDKARRSAEHYSPELRKKIKEEIENRGERAPKGWITNKTLCKELNVAQGTTKRVADKYRETNPERFKEYLNVKNRSFEHYSPELLKKIKEELHNQ